MILPCAVRDQLLTADQRQRVRVRNHGIGTTVSARVWGAVITAYLIELDMGGRVWRDPQHVAVIGPVEMANVIAFPRRTQERSP